MGTLDSFDGKLNLSSEKVGLKRQKSVAGMIEGEARNLCDSRSEFILDSSNHGENATRWSLEPHTVSSSVRTRLKTMA